VSQSRSRAQLQASQKGVSRPCNCTERKRKRGPAAAARAVSPLSHAFWSLFSLLPLSLAWRVAVRTSTVRGRALLRESQVSQVSSLRGAALSIHHPGWRASHGSDRGHPGLGECSAATKLPVRPVLIYCFGCCSLLAFFLFLLSSLLFLIPRLIPLRLLFTSALALRLQPTYSPCSSKAS
jgi:hypothetical protein